MTEAVYSKIDIAREYLDAAIEFFLAGDNFFCVIHLAAAAEELFGAHLPESQRISTLAGKQKSPNIRDKANAVRCGSAQKCERVEERR